MIPRMTRLAALIGLATLAACSDNTMRFEVPTPPETTRIPVGVTSLEVTDVSLPLYATQEVIFVQSATGTLVSDTDLLWADDPRRTFTEGLAFALAAKTRATVAAEPWPFFERPAAQLDVRFTRALAQNNGLYVIEGQYFVAREDGGRDVAQRFRVAEPYTAPTRGAIAAAQSRAIGALATLIAQNGL